MTSRLEAAEKIRDGLAKKHRVRRMDEEDWEAQGFNEGVQALFDALVEADLLRETYPTAWRIDESFVNGDGKRVHSRWGGRFKTKEEAQRFIDSVGPRWGAGIKDYRTTIVQER